MSSRRGFTLVELLTVVALIGIIAAIALVSMRRGRTNNDADSWASSVRNVAQQARRRAVATNQPYLLEVGGKWLRWCQVTCASPPTGCPTTPTAGLEMGSILWAPADAVTSGIANAAQQVTTFNTTFAVPTQQPISATSSLPIYFAPGGTVTTSTTNICIPTTAGATVYVQASNAGGSTSETQKHRRIVINGITGRPRIIDNW